MKVAFTTASFSPAEPNPGAFNLLEQLVWVGWNAVTRPPVWTKQPDSGGLRPLPSEPWSGSSLVRILSAPITGSVVFTCNFLCWLLGEKLVICGYQNGRQGTNIDAFRQPVSHQSLLLPVVPPPHCSWLLKKRIYNQIVECSLFNHAVTCAVSLFIYSPIANQPVLHYLGDKNCEGFAFSPTWLSDQWLNSISSTWLLFPIYSLFEVCLCEPKQNITRIWFAPKKQTFIRTCTQKTQNHSLCIL